MATTTAILDELLQRLQTERDRLLLEATALDVMQSAGCVAATALIGPLALIWCDEIVPGELPLRADVLEGLAVEVERFVSQADLDEMEGDPAKLARYLEAAQQILALVSSTSGVDDLLADTAALVDDIATSARRFKDAATSSLSFFSAGAALGALALGLVFLRSSPR